MVIFPSVFSIFTRPSKSLGFWSTSNDPIWDIRAQFDLPLGILSPWPTGYLVTYLLGDIPILPGAGADKARQEARQQLEEALGEAVPMD